MELEDLLVLLADRQGQIIKEKELTNELIKKNKQIARLNRKLLISNLWLAGILLTTTYLIETDKVSFNLESKKKEKVEVINDEEDKTE